jgi:hypothetical protein
MKTTSASPRLEANRIPDLATDVALCGSTTLQEVGSSVCLIIAGGIAIYVSW